MSFTRAQRSILITFFKKLIPKFILILFFPKAIQSLSPTEDMELDNSPPIEPSNKRFYFLSIWYQKNAKSNSFRRKLGSGGDEELERREK